MKSIPKRRALRSELMPGAGNLPGSFAGFKKPPMSMRAELLDESAFASLDDNLMDRFVIRGGNPLVGTIRVSGAKNAALPAMAAAILTDETVILENVPDVRDIHTERRLLETMGAEVQLAYGGDPHRTSICCRNLSNPEAAYDLVKTMRASTLVLGPLVARTGRARVSLPGGCAIGARPIDLHIKGLEKLGATITQEHGYIEASAERLHGGHIIFDKITVTGTEDLMMAAALAEGETVMENCAREPEVSDLAALLNKMGAQVEGAGTSTIRIHGVSKLRGARHRIIPDRIEAATFIIAAALTGGDLTVANCDPRHLGALLHKLEECGLKLSPGKDSVRVTNGHKLRAADVNTEEYPGFPTDMQAQYMTLATQAEGSSVITENIFENRFMHAQELVRMGANIRVEGRRAVVRGSTPLSGAAVQCSDLRASASLVIAALVAQGETILDRVYHIDRGYERIEEKLSAVGAQIKRIGEMLPERTQTPVGVA
jgi:UDP-N-acetylglucosamine 1-carboxyvinyltransferase